MTVPVLVGHVLDPLPHAPDAGVRHEQVDGAELALHVVHQSDRGIAVREVGARRERPGAAGGQLARELVSARRVAGVGERDRGPGACQATGDRRADASARSGYECYAAGECVTCH